MKKRLVGAVQTVSKTKRGGLQTVLSVDTTTSNSDLNNAFPTSLFRVFSCPRLLLGLDHLGY